MWMACLEGKKMPKKCRGTNITSNCIKCLNWGIIDWKLQIIWIYFNSNINLCFEKHRYFEVLDPMLDLRIFLSRSCVTHPGSINIKKWLSDLPKCYSLSPK